MRWEIRFRETAELPTWRAMLRYSRLPMTDTYTPRRKSGNVDGISVEHIQSLGRAGHRPYIRKLGISLGPSPKVVWMNRPLLTELYTSKFSSSVTDFFLFDGQVCSRTMDLCSELHISLFLRLPFFPFLLCCWRVRRYCQCCSCSSISMDWSSYLDDRNGAVTRIINPTACSKKSLICISC